MHGDAKIGFLSQFQITKIWPTINNFRVRLGVMVMRYVLCAKHVTFISRLLLLTVVDVYRVSAKQTNPTTF